MTLPLECEKVGGGDDCWRTAEIAQRVKTERVKGGCSALEDQTQDLVMLIKRKVPEVSDCGGQCLTVPSDDGEGRPPSSNPAGELLRRGYLPPSQQHSSSGQAPPAAPLMKMSQYQVGEPRNGRCTGELASNRQITKPSFYPKSFSHLLPVPPLGLSYLSS